MLFLLKILCAYYSMAGFYIQLLFVDFSSRSIIISNKETNHSESKVFPEAKIDLYKDIRPAADDALCVVSSCSVFISNDQRHIRENGYVFLCHKKPRSYDIKNAPHGSHCGRDENSAQAPAAGGESCKAGFFLIFHRKLRSYDMKNAPRGLHCGGDEEFNRWR